MTALAIILRPMHQDEYPAYQAYFVADYSQDLRSNHGLSPEMAQLLALQSLEKSFGRGLENSEHELLCIEKTENDQTELVGYLWHQIDAVAKSSFIYDFYVDENYRSRGFGRQAMAQLEALLAGQDVNQIKLRVAYQNPRALALYQEIGFSITGYNMAKSLS